MKASANGLLAGQTRTRRMVEKIRSIGAQVGDAIKAGGIAAIGALSVAALAYLAIAGPPTRIDVNTNVPDRYTGTQAAADWREQRTFNETVAKHLESFGRRMEEHERAQHPTTATHNATVEAKLGDVLRRLDRMEAKLDSGNR